MLLFSSCIFLTSIVSISNQAYDRLEAAQDMSIFSLSLTDSPSETLYDPLFWEKGKKYQSDDFYPIDKESGEGLFKSSLTDVLLKMTAQGLSEEPSRRIRLDYRSIPVFSVGRSYSLRGREYELFAETDISDVYLKNPFNIILHFLLVLLSIFIYRSSVVKDKKIIKSKKLLDINNTEEHAIYYEFFKACSYGAILINSDGFILDANYKLRDILGYSISDFKKMHIDDLVPEEYRDSNMSLVKVFFDDKTIGMSEVREIKGLHKSGSIINIGLSVGILRSFDYKGNETLVGAGLVFEKGI